MPRPAPARAPAPATASNLLVLVQEFACLGLELLAIDVAFLQVRLPLVIDAGTGLLPALELVGAQDGDRVAPVLGQLRIGLDDRVETDLAGEGRVLLRPSGTEPLLRVMVEGRDENKVQAAAERLAATVRAAVGD